MDDSIIEADHGNTRKLHAMDDGDKIPRIMQLKSRLGIASEFGKNSNLEESRGVSCNRS